jgi:hypothetical protein
VGGRLRASMAGPHLDAEAGAGGGTMAAFEFDEFMRLVRQAEPHFERVYRVTSWLTDRAKSRLHELIDLIEEDEGSAEVMEELKDLPDETRRKYLAALRYVEQNYKGRARHSQKLVVGLWSKSSTLDPTDSARPRSNASVVGAIDARIAGMRKCLEKLKARVDSKNISASQAIRGIFAAPEYSFQKPNALGYNGVDARYYGHSLKQEQKEHAVAKLQELSRDFPTILMVPGTVAWKKPLDRAGTEARKRDPLTGQRTGPLKTLGRREKAIAQMDRYAPSGRAITTYYTINITPAVKDAIKAYLTDEGYDDSDGNVDIIKDDPKAFRDALDDYYAEPDRDTLLGLFDKIPGQAKKKKRLATATSMMRNTAFVLLDGRVRFKYNKVGDYHEAIGDHGDTVFVNGDMVGLGTIHGIRFGFEICLDHALGTLSQLIKQTPGGTRPDVHIVVSDKVSNVNKNMKPREGGYFLHASTDDAATGVYKHSSSGKSARTDFAHTTVLGDPLHFYQIRLRP